MLISLLCCFDESDRLNAAFFFFASITLTLFEKPKQQNQEKCRGGYFRRDNRDQASSRIPYRPNLNFDRSRMVLRQECFGMQSLPQRVQKTNWQAVRETQESIDARAREKNQWTWLRSPPRSMQNHHETDPNNSVTVMQTMRRILRCRIVRF